MAKRSVNKTGRSKASRSTDSPQPPFHLTGYKDESTTTDSSSSLQSSTSASASSASSRPSSSFDETIEGVARLLRGKKNIVVLVGAGISTSCGIPDFRSKDNGLYNSLDLSALGLSEPEDLFCAEFFSYNPAPFYQFAKNLYFPSSVATTTETTSTNATATPTKIIPSDSHKLLALLDEKKMLLRVYTQNIDGLEESAGVSEKKVVYAHGSLRYAKCLKCRKKVSSELIMDDILCGSVARCRQSIKPRKQKDPNTTTKKSKNKTNGTNDDTTNDAETANETIVRPPSQRLKSRSRSISSIDEDAVSNTSRHSNQDGFDGLCGGVMKPAITFFGETLGDTVSRSLEADRKKADAVIVIGTSLSVAPISKVIEFLPSNIPRILINRTIVHPPSFSASTKNHTSVENGKKNNEDEENEQESEEEEEVDFRGNAYFFDAYLLGFCDDVTRCLAKQLFKDKNCSSTESPEKKKRRKTKKTTGLENILPLTSMLQEPEDESIWNHEEWKDAVRVPHERVVLFPGAEAKNISHSSTGHDYDDLSDKDIVFGEVAHCDGCSKQIQGTIYKCKACFDFDLCPRCYRQSAKKHFNGTHHFIKEESSSVS